MARNIVDVKVFYVILFFLIVWNLLYFDLLREWQSENFNQPGRVESQIQVETNEVQNKKYGVLLENILTATKQPEQGRDIFFIDTTYMRRRKTERPFTSRQACAVESAGRQFRSAVSKI